MSENASWVKACYSPVVPGTRVHAMALTPLVLWTVWWSWANFFLLLFVAGGFIVLEIKGRRPMWIVSRQKSRLRGQVVAARPYWYLRRRNRLESFETLTPSAAWAVSPQPADSAPAPSAQRKALG